VVSKLINIDTKNDEFSLAVHEEIRNEAHKIYLSRINKGIHSSAEQGSAEQDWHKAVAEFKKREISNSFKSLMF
jgi:hypothetical protein